MLSKNLSIEPIIDFWIFKTWDLLGGNIYDSHGEGLIYAANIL